MQWTANGRRAASASSRNAKVGRWRRNARIETFRRLVRRETKLSLVFADALPFHPHSLSVAAAMETAFDWESSLADRVAIVRVRGATRRSPSEVDPFVRRSSVAAPRRRRVPLTLSRSSPFRSTPYAFFQHANAVDQSLNSFFVHLDVLHSRVVLNGRKTRADRRAIRIVTRRLQWLGRMNFHACFRTLDERRETMNETRRNERRLPARRLFDLWSIDLAEEPWRSEATEKSQIDRSANSSYHGPRSGEELRDRTGTTGRGVTICLGRRTDGMTAALVFFGFTLFTTRVRIRRPGRAARWGVFALAA